VSAAGTGSGVSAAGGVGSGTGCGSGRTLGRTAGALTAPAGAAPATAGTHRDDTVQILVPNTHQKMEGVRESRYFLAPRRC
jgi:hypothetical protein